MFSEIYVSLIIPIFNEKKFIRHLLNSLTQQDYPRKNLEIFLVDGRSEDGTREEIKKIISSSPELKDLSISIIDNPKIVVPCALNIGVRKSKGAYIIRMDGHTEYASNYISKCVEWLEETKVENVGGPIISKPGNDTLIARAIALATSNFFGVGNSKFRTSQKAEYVDTVTFGSWPKRVFEEMGLFDERLVRNQDIEFNARIRKSGGKIYLTPEIKSYYYCRNNLKGLWKQNYENGKWVIFTKAIAPYCLSWRHFIPLLFVVSLVISGLMSFVSSQFGMEKLFSLFSLLFAGVVFSYVFTNLAFSLLLSFKKGFQYFLIIPIVFATLHFSYGFGSICGLIKLRSWFKYNKSTKKIFRFRYNDT